MKREGFTVTEVLVALMILSIGGLAGLGAAAAGARELGRAARLEHGVAAAEALYDSLLALPTWDAAAGSRIEDGVRLDWSVEGLTIAIDVHHPPEAGLADFSLVGRRPPPMPFVAP